MITANDVKKLREITGAGMMDCKRALTETAGDKQAAIDWLRKKGIQSADKKAGRDTKSGLVGVVVQDKTAHIVELNCETDFVARSETFQNFVMGCLDNAVNRRTISDEELAAMIMKVGENLKLGKQEVLVAHEDGYIVTYVHNKVSENLGSIAVAVAVVGGNQELGKNIACQIAAMSPKAVDIDGLDPEWVNHERKLYTEQAMESGKPQNIVEKMVDGRVNKAFREVTLLNQPFVKDQDYIVRKVLDDAGMTVTGFIRVQVGD